MSLTPIVGASLQAQVVHLNRLIGVLERFNGTHFVTVGEDSVTTGTGQTLAEKTTTPNTGTGETSRYVFVPINAGQLTLLEQSYAQLKQSVYDGLALQTRLKPYLDQAMNDCEWRSVA